ncbi:MAG: hypothetical protein E7301_01980 [Butyrivibrio sp.]|nr:hypothetical protein [Butyrivibrio sp.]
MQLNKNKLSPDDANFDHHSIDDLGKRRDYLTEKLGDDPYPDTKRALEIFDLRFKKNGDKWTDNFMLALMMLLSEDSGSSFSLFKNSGKKRVITYLNSLLLCDKSGNKLEPDEELKSELLDLGARYLYSCADSKTYGSTLFGMIPMKDKQVAMKIYLDIKKVSVDVPEKYGLSDIALPLKEALEASFASLIENGADILNLS